MVIKCERTGKKNVMFGQNYNKTTIMFNILIKGRMYHLFYMSLVHDAEYLSFKTCF